MSKRKNLKPEKTHKDSHKLKGTLDIVRSGMGYVIVAGLEKDVIVKPSDFGGAFHGDIVQVKITREASHGKRCEGKVIEVIERKQTEFIGDIEVSKNFAFFTASAQKAMPDFFVHPKNLNGAVDGDKVIVRLLKWEQGDRKPEGTVVQVLKQEDLNDIAMNEILTNAGFELKFNEQTIAEANALPIIIADEEIKKRKDCRDYLTFTIDPVDAKDFDDAISIRYLRDGLYEIGVHIADVSHYVKPDTQLDETAYQRATSVYLPDRVNPMLPENISNVLCSLRPHEDKCTFSAIFMIDTKGEVKNTWLGKTVIHSKHRFTYEEVQDIIDKKSSEPYKKEIFILNDLAQKFRRQRFKNGAINFSSQEVRFVLDEQKKPIGITIKESKESHQLVEEFMLLANRKVAEHIAKIKINKKPVPFPYRIHDTPDDEKLKPFVAFAKKFGYKFNMQDEIAVAKSFNNLLKEVHGKPEQHVLEQLGIRTMAKAIYTSENIGHYGLGFENYCHFTSPIRRYPDVMVHRILHDCLQHSHSIDKKMEEKCKHCSDRERAAMESERAGNKYKQVEYMSNFLGEDFEGIITGVAAFGFWVETALHKCEGLVSVRDLLLYDDFRHSETDYALIGLRTGKAFRMGDRIKIKVVAANLGKRQLDYEWIMEGEVKKNEMNKKKIKNKLKKQK